jgi:hypothetical protein
LPQQPSRYPVAFTVTGLDGWAIPDLRIAAYSPQNTPGDGFLAPAGWQAGWPVA